MTGSIIKGLGLTAREEIELLKCANPYGLSFYNAEKLVYDFINKTENKKLFNNCIVSSNTYNITVQRIKKSYKNNKKNKGKK